MHVLGAAKDVAGTWKERAGGMGFGLRGSERGRKGPRCVSLDRNVTLCSQCVLFPFSAVIEHRLSSENSFLK